MFTDIDEAVESRSFVARFTHGMKIVRTNPHEDWSILRTGFQALSEFRRQLGSYTEAIDVRASSGLF